MPYKDPQKQREAARKSAARRRAVKRAAKAVAKARADGTDPVQAHDNPVDEFARWCRENLVVPPGHANVGQPFEVPAYFLDFLRDALASGIREAGCFVARKNAKSACVAALILAHLAANGPFRRKGWRCGVASLSRDKAIELWQQVSDIVAASRLQGIRCGKVPRIVESAWGRVDILSADRTAGHASGFDLVVADELGLFPETARDLMSGLLTSTSARDGRLIAISVIGDSHLSRELIDRAGQPGVAVTVHQAPTGCGLDDEAAWRAANPTLGQVKSLGYMRAMARRAKANPREQSAFRAYDLNQPGGPDRQMIVSLDSFEECVSAARPGRDGECYVGIDLGGSTSMTAAALYWPLTGRIECYGAFGDQPNLVTRGEADGVGRRYQELSDRGELRTWPGRVTPVAEFLVWIAEELDGETIALGLADRYRQAEALDALSEAGVSWPMEWRGQGAGKDGSADIRAFQRSVEGGTLRPGPSLLLLEAIVESELRYDGNGNPALEKARSRGRIDALSAAVLAVGAGSRLAAPIFEFAHASL